MSMKALVRKLQWVMFAAVMAVAIGEGCNCGDDTVSCDGDDCDTEGDSDVTPPEDWSCEEQGRRPRDVDQACGDKERFFNGTCGHPRCDVRVADEGIESCCPGMVCSGGACLILIANRGTECWNRNEEVPDDNMCDNGMKCFERPDIDPGKPHRCAFPKSDAAGGCEAGTHLFNQHCVGVVPCGGGCDVGKVCNIQSNRCEDAPAYLPAGNSCEITCDSASILVFEDPANMLFDSCCAVTCICEPLPPLAPGAWGRYADMTVSDTDVQISAYDATYGDLVRAVLDPANAGLESISYVDGVPTTEDPVWGPGPRGGRVGLGENVGQHTSIAVNSDGEARITYYDVDNQDLKYAGYDSDSDSWTVITIDNGGGAPDATGTGDVGKFTNITLDSTGRPHITYYAHRINIGGRVVSTPMYATADSPFPTSDADFSKIPIDPLGECGRNCSDLATCVDNGGAALCMELVADGCGATGCPCDQACVNVGGTASCMVLAAERLLPPCDAACVDTELCVLNASGFETCTEEGDTCAAPCDTGTACVVETLGPICRPLRTPSTIEGLPKGNGLFNSTVIRGDTIWTVYYDSIRHQLRGAVADFTVGQAPTGFSAMPILEACDPTMDFGQHASMQVAPDGSLGVAYQGFGGQTLWHWQGDQFATGRAEPVDEGLRTGRIDRVGAYASLAYLPDGTALIAYANQSRSNTLLTYRRIDTWSSMLLLEDGAYGGSTRLAVLGDIAYIATYLRDLSDPLRDGSQLVVVTRDVTLLP